MSVSTLPSGGGERASSQLARNRAERTAEEQARRSRTRRVTVFCAQVLVIVGLLLLWQLVGSSRPLFYSTPTRVVSAYRSLARHGLLGQAGDSLRALLEGLAIAFVAGVTIGFLMARFRVIRVALEPYLAAFYAIPRVALVPIMVVWFGINETFVIAASWVSFMFSTYAGVREVGLRYYEVATSLQIKRQHLLFKVLLPGSVPFISSGLKLAFEQAIAAVVVAEFLVGVPGVGFMLRSARAELDAASLFALAVVLMVFGMICVGLATLLERRFSTWRPAT